MVINNYSTDAKIARWVSSTKPKPRIDQASRHFRSPWVLGSSDLGYRGEFKSIVMVYTL